AWCDPKELGRALNNRKRIKVSDIKVAPIEVQRRRHDMALGGRNVDDTADHTRRRDLNEVAGVWVEGEEITADFDHAVPSSFGTKILRIGMRHWVGHHPCAQVGDQGPVAAW